MTSFRTPSARVHVVRSSRDAPILTRLAEAGVEAPAVELARALAASPPARRMAGVSLAVRSEPHPLFVFAGSIPAEATPLLALLPTVLDEAAPRLRLVGWPEVEAAVSSLAAAVRVELRADELAEARLLALPRGGLIAAGLLAYALDVPRDRISLATPGGEEAGPEEGAGAGGPVILVDDGLISGVRLRETLEEMDAREVVVASLFAHPELCAAVERAEPRVRACLAGEDLVDHGPRLLDSEYPAWRREWMERVPRRYHAALLDLLVLPWSEPHTRLWNEADARIESSWWLGPPSLCLHHRETDPALDVQLADDIPGLDLLAPWVVPVARPEGMLLVDCAHGRTTGVPGTAGDFLREWLRGGPEKAAAAVADAYDIGEARARADLQRLLEGLARRGLLAEERNGGTRQEGAGNGSAAEEDPRAGPELRVRVRAVENRLASRVADETVILNPDTGRYHGLRGTGSRIWELIADGTTLGALEARLVAEYDVEPRQCRADLRALLEELDRSGLVELERPASEVRRPAKG